MSFFRLLTNAAKFLNSPAGRATVTVAKMTPKVVRSIDKWYSSYTYEQAKEKLQEMEYQDTNKLRDIYFQQKHDMSPGVRKAFEERLGL